MQVQRLGFEIRKMGDIKNLYSDVDTILGRFKIPEQGINAGVQITTVAHTLQKLLSVDSFFSVCTIKNCAELCQICISKERMQVYNAIHCMHWNEMLPEYRQMIVAMVMDDFRAVLCPQ